MVGLWGRPGCVPELAPHSLLSANSYASSRSQQRAPKDRQCSRMPLPPWLPVVPHHAGGAGSQLARVAASSMPTLHPAMRREPEHLARGRCAIIPFHYTVARRTSAAAARASSKGSNGMGGASELSEPDHLPREAMHFREAGRRKQPRLRLLLAWSCCKLNRADEQEEEGTTKKP